MLTILGGALLKRKKKIEKKAAKEDTPSIKTLVVGDSNLRHVDQLGTTAKVLSSTRAKIGHTANALKFEELNEYENLVLHTGQNNIDMKPDVIFAQWENQVRFEINQLTQQLKKFGGEKKIIAVPESELACTNDQSIKMRTTINELLRELACKLEKNEIIEIDDDLGDDEEAWVDYRHYSEIMCGKVLETVNLTYTGENKLLTRGKKATSSRKYHGVHPSYRVGCGQCTRIGHSEERCENQIAKKRANVSRSPPPSS